MFIFFICQSQPCGFLLSRLMKCSMVFLSSSFSLSARGSLGSSSDSNLLVSSINAFRIASLCSGSIASNVSWSQPLQFKFLFFRFLRKISLDLCQNQIWKLRRKDKRKEKDFFAKLSDLNGMGEVINQVENWDKLDFL